MMSSGVGRRRIAFNVFSNWANLVTAVVIAFLVSPVIVHSLGNQLYGVWTLIVSITGYFTVLDLGVNTAVIRYVSRSEALGRRAEVARVFSSSLVLFVAMAGLAALLTLVLAPILGRAFDSPAFPRAMFQATFLIIGCDVAVGLIMSVFVATLKARQDFLQVNAVAIVANVPKNVLIVLLLVRGYGIVSMALVQLASTVLKLGCQYLWVRRHYRFSRSVVDRGMLRELMSYSVYSLIISVVIKLIFYTDSVVIAAVIAVDQIVFYSIPVTLLVYAERVVYAMMSVLTPVVSSNEARNDVEGNRALYRYGTRYSLVLVLPMLFVLFTNGREFISLWMGPEYGERSARVLQILCIGYVVYLSQVIANSILKGISRHRVLAGVLLLEAVANLGLSILLAPRYGLPGVALGTTIPLLVVNVFVVPLYTCRVLGMGLAAYLRNAYAAPLLLLAPALAVDRFLPFRAESYLQFLVYAACVALYFLAGSALLIVEPEHRRQLVAWAGKRLRG